MSFSDPTPENLRSTADAYDSAQASPFPHRISTVLRDAADYIERMESMDAPDKVSIHGMFDCHLFIQFKAPTVDGIIEAWREQLANPYPATVGGEAVADLGPTSLCPAIVLRGKAELRRVGPMLHPDYKTREPSNTVDVEAYRAALLADPDISRLLRASHEEEGQ